MILTQFSCSGAPSDILAAPGEGKRLTIWGIQFSASDTGRAAVYFGTDSPTSHLVFADFVNGANGYMNFSQMGGIRTVDADVALKGSMTNGILRGVVYYTVD